jgi:P4 family phage/plasmid primase-like protien
MSTNGAPSITGPSVPCETLRAAAPTRSEHPGGWVTTKLRPPKLLEAALHYAELGHPVLPLHSVRNGACTCGDATCTKNMGKHPRTVHGKDEASTDPATIRAWFAKWPDSNIGLRGDKFFALDIDPRSGGDHALAALVEKYGDLPVTVHQLTGGGGDHYLFTQPNPPVGNSKLAGVEFKGHGGYICAEPTLHASGREYVFEDGAGFDDIPLAAAPGWLLDLIDEHEREKQKSKGDASAIDHHHGNGELPQDKLEALLENNLNFRRTWDFARTDLADRSASVHDQALANMAVSAGWSDSEIGALIAAFRERHGEKPQKGHRPDYLARTIATARAALATTTEGAPDADGRSVPLGGRDPKTGKLVLSPKRTLPTAEAFVKEFHHHDDGRTLHAYAGGLWVWNGTRYVEAEDGGLRQRLQPWLHKALRYVVNRKTGEPELMDFESNPNTINAALESVRALTHLPATVTPPTWLDGLASRPDPRDLLPTPDGLLDVTTRMMHPATPALFNVNGIDYHYDPNADGRERWIRFLEQLFGDDLESVELLQEWLGYCLSADTSQQKMLLIVGPKRSGKGTIARLLTRLIGVGNVVSPTTGSLAGAFGLQPLIGKSLAIVSDARFHGENIGSVVERLLCISGEDSLSIDRKFLGAVTMRLPTRFMLLTNELPRWNDSSGALAGRFLILRLTRTFYGHEDIRLTDKLIEELPGILLWSLDGLRRLRDRGHFRQPTSVADAIRDLEELSSPVSAFVRERCVLGAGYRVDGDTLYLAWTAWCRNDGRTYTTTRQWFGRDLAAAAPGVVSRRGTLSRFYEGIGLDDGGGL